MTSWAERRRESGLAKEGERRTGRAGGVMTGPCRKRRYATLDDAEVVLLRAKIARALRRQNAQQRREERVYACRNCGGWHLTSQPGRYSGDRPEDVAS